LDPHGLIGAGIEIRALRVLHDCADPQHWRNRDGGWRRD